MRWAVFGMILLAGCGPAPYSEDPTVAGDTTVLSNGSGLVERTPDTCSLSDFQYLLGQPVSAFNPSSTTRPVRVVAPGSIVTNEYNPQRVNLDTNGNGVVTNVRCG
ncbi:MAG: I78 family peptidase inhibitor [Pseudomonadota bacterium]